MEEQFRTDLNSDAWLKDLFDQAHDLIQIIHLDGTILHVNKAWSTVLGYHHDEIMGKSIYSFIRDKDKQRYRDYREEILNGRSAQPIVFELTTKAGTNLSVEGIVSAKFIDGKPVYTRGIFRDITARLGHEAELRRLNSELAEREQGIRQLLLNAPDAVIVIDEQSNITFWNPKAERLFGWTVDEVMNKALSDIIIPVQYREAHRKGMKRYLATGEARVLNRTIEITALDRSRREFYISLTISSTTYLNSRSFIAFIRDISEERANREQLTLRTEALERSNADLERFAHTASHDIQEPIRKMHLFADMLKGRLSGKLGEEELVLFNKIQAAYKRASALIAELLKYARLEKEQSSYGRVDLNEILREVRENLDLQVQEKHAKISVGVLPVTHGHHGQLYQVFDNLTGNALKYSKQDLEPVIVITSKEKKDLGPEVLPAMPGDAGQFYIIEVKDNGIGLDKQHYDTIFNPFTRLHSNAQIEGTGVGLSIVRRILENHGGFITVESTPGGGSSFYVFLPK